MIAIVTDSTAYLTESEAIRYGVEVVPSSFIVEGKLYRERYADSPVYQSSLYLAKPDVTTFQPSVVDFVEAFSRLSQLGLEIICITISSKLSRAYAHALEAVTRLPSAKIRVVNSTLTVSGQFMLIRRARSYICAGMGLSELEARLNEDKKHIRIRFTVDELSSLVRSKRLSYARRSVSTALGSRPVLECRGGSLSVIANPHGGELIRQLTAPIPKTATVIMINYIERSAIISSLVRFLHLTHPSTELKLRKIGPVVGINIGGSIIALSWFE